jgi:hypothetical protein
MKKSVLPIQMKLVNIKYTMKRNFSNSGANRKLPPLKMLKLQFAVLSPFTPLSSKENSEIPALRASLGFWGYSTRLLSCVVYVGSHRVTIAWIVKVVEGNVKVCSKDISHNRLTADIPNHDLPNMNQNTHHSTTIFHNREDREWFITHCGRLPKGQRHTLYPPIFYFIGVLGVNVLRLKCHCFVSR